MAARVYQSALELIALSNPNARVYQSVIEIIAIPGVVPPVNTAVNVRITLLGVKRRPLERGTDMQEVPEIDHVIRAV